MSTVSIKTNAIGTSGSIEIDGMDVAKYVRGFDLSARVQELTVLNLEVVSRKGAEFDGEAFVQLDPAFEDFLLNLGWTRPRPAAELRAEITCGVRELKPVVDEAGVRWRAVESDGTATLTVWGPRDEVLDIAERLRTLEESLPGSPGETASPAGDEPEAGGPAGG